MFHEYPYTDFHDINLDWVIGKVKNVEVAEANTQEYMEIAVDAKNTAVDAKNTAVDAKDTAVNAKNTAVQAKNDAQDIVTDTQTQINVLQARVDNIIPDGTQTAGNTELLDIRVGADGHIYDSAGNAVRGQVGDLADALDLLGTEVIGKNKVKEATMGTYRWDMTLLVYLEAGKTYTIYKLLDNGKPVNLGTNIILQDTEGVDITTIKNNYNGYYSYTFTPNVPTDFYLLKLGFTAQQAVGYENRFMVVAESVVIIQDTVYPYEAWTVYLYAKNALQADSSSTADMVISRYYETVHLSYGDSITDQALWQSDFHSYIGTSNEIIKGFSGDALWAHCTLAKLTTDLGGETFDFATVMFGTNDWGQSRQIGVNTDFNDTGDFDGTFKGSLNSFCKNITTLFPAKHIIFVTPPNGFEDYDYLNRPFTDNGRKNLLGLTMRDYADAAKEICALWGVPCYDFNAFCGWNYVNKSTYLTNDGNGTYVHPNATGAEEYAYKLAKFCEAN